MCNEVHSPLSKWPSSSYRERKSCQRRNQSFNVTKSRGPRASKGEREEANGVKQLGEKRTERVRRRGDVEWKERRQEGEKEWRKGEVGPHWTQTEKEEGGENNSLAHLKVHTQKMCSWTRGCQHQCKILQPWWFFYRNTVVTVTMSKCKWLHETSDIS